MNLPFIKSKTYYIRSEFSDYDGYAHLRGDRFVFSDQIFDEVSGILDIRVRVDGRRLVSFRLHIEKQKYIVDKFGQYFSLSKYGINDFYAAYNKKRFDIKGMYGCATGDDKDGTGRSLYHAAAKYADHWAVSFLKISNVPLDADINARTPLHELADTMLKISHPSNFDAVYKTAIALVEAGDNPTRPDRYGTMAYVRAAEHLLIPFIKAMADKKVRMDLRFDNGQNLLHRLCKSSGLSEEALDKTCEIIKILLGTKTFDVSMEDIYGFTPLYYACNGDYPAIADLLLAEDDAVINICQAVETDNIKIVRSLIASGADINQTNKKGHTPLMIAISLWQNPREIRHRYAQKHNLDRQDFDMIKLLLENGADVNYWLAQREENIAFAMLQMLFNEECFPILRMLIAHGLDLNAPADRLQNTILMAACFNYYNSDFRYKLVEILLKAKADINRKNFNGFTALHCLATVSAEISEVARLIVNEGAELNGKSDQGETPLMLAAENPVGGYNLVRLLLENNCDTSLVNNFGKTALRIAIDCGNESIAKLLLKQ